MLEQILWCPPARDLLERGARLLQICQDEFFGQRQAVFCKGRVPRLHECIARPLDERDVPNVGHRRQVRQPIKIKRVQHALFERIQSLAS